MMRFPAPSHLVLQHSAVAQVSVAESHSTVSTTSMWCDAPSSMPTACPSAFSTWREARDDGDESRQVPTLAGRRQQPLAQEAANTGRSENTQGRNPEASNIGALVELHLRRAWAAAACAGTQQYLGGYSVVVGEPHLHQVQAAAACAGSHQCQAR